MADSGAVSGALPSFPPHVLRQYALLADGQRGAVIGPRGDIAWMCAPWWDSEPLFDGMLGGAGRYAVTPHEPAYVWGGSYTEQSLVWTSRWTSTTAVVESDEALAMPAPGGTAVLLRRVRAARGEADVDVVLAPRAGFAGAGVRDVARRGAAQDGVWTARCGDLHLRWSGAGPAVRHGARGWELRLRVPDGATHDLVLEISPDPFGGPPPDAALLWEQTRAHWHRAAVPMDATIAPRDAAHAHAVLRGLTSPGGGMVAAATTSLPERSSAGRDYDYRYVWIRDQCYAGMAAAAVGATDLLDAAVSFVGDRLRTDGAAMVPAYTTRGGRVPDQHEVSDPAGYPGGGILVGNWVNQQFQLDALGESLLLLSAAAERDRLDLSGWQAVQAAVAAVEQRWTEPDAGIWELGDRRWAHSRLTCVAGLRAAARHAPAGQAAGWESLADTVLADVSRTCLTADGRWRRADDDERVDAALLLPAVRGALPVDDPRTVATRAAVRAGLEDDLMVYRFRHDERPLGDAEGAFVLCGFLSALDAHAAGEKVRAGRLFERNRAACGPPGLLTEEFDIAQRQLRGNLPQAFVHAVMLETAHRLAD